MSDDTRSQRPVRLIDVARAAGVSPQTVSNVVNRRDVVADSTRERVLEAIRRTGYRPHRAAVQLRTRRSRQLGLHLTAAHLDPRNIFAITFLRELVRAAEQIGYQLVAFTRLGAESSEGTGLSSGVDGFILFDVQPDDERPRTLADAHIPFAALGRLRQDLPPSSVDIDNATAMAPVVDRLVDRGRRRFAYVGHPGQDYWTLDRLRGTEARLVHHGLRLSADRIVTVDPDAAGTVLAQVVRGPNRPDALVCGSDVLATIALRAATRAGLRPGDDIGVTGFGTLPGTVDSDAALTSVAFPLRSAAEAAVRIVVNRVEHDAVPDHELILPTHLVLGDTA